MMDHGLESGLRNLYCSGTSSDQSVHLHISSGYLLAAILSAYREIPPNFFQYFHLNYRTIKQDPVLKRVLHKQMFPSILDHYQSEPLLLVHTDSVPKLVCQIRIDSVLTMLRPLLPPPYLLLNYGSHEWVSKFPARLDSERKLRALGKKAAWSLLWLRGRVFFERQQSQLRPWVQKLGLPDAEIIGFPNAETIGLLSSCSPLWRADWSLVCDFL